MTIFIALVNSIGSSYLNENLYNLYKILIKKITCFA